MDKLRWSILAVALVTFVSALPLSAADSGDGSPPACVTLESANLVTRTGVVWSVGDAIELGLETTVPAQVSAILIIVPANCNVPSPWDVLGQIMQGSASPVPPPASGVPNLP
jgi:hypothetical protein